jgi:hypothetical protein
MKHISKADCPNYFVIALSLAVLGNATYQPEVLAKEHSPHFPEGSTLLTEDPFADDGKPINQSSGGADFADDGRPGSQSAGGSRGNCPTVTIPLTSLMPDANYGTTTLERPTLWFYVPYAADTVMSGLFSLQDAEGEDIAAPIPFSIPTESPGFVSVTFPEAFALTDVDAEYHWYFELDCEGSDIPLVVDGWIQRVENSADLQSQLNAVNTADDLVYTNNRIWYDAIASLAALRTINPNDPELLERWNALLTANGVSLGNLPTEPFVGEVVVEE